MLNSYSKEISHRKSFASATAASGISDRTRRVGAVSDVTPEFCARLDGSRGQIRSFKALCYALSASCLRSPP